MHQNETIPLQASEVFKNYGQVEALKGLNLDVQKGEVFGLLGPNGAGKTTLISIVVTLEKPDRGQVKVFGHDVSLNPRLAKTNLGWVPQEIINHGFFNVEEILGFHAGYYGVSKPQARIKYLLESLGLYEHRLKKVKQLSGGMKRRLMIAKALVHSPGLLLLDEPTAGVDVELRSKLWDFVEEQRDQGLSILLTTHYLEEAERLCDRVAIINKGKIIEMGKTKELITKWSRKRTTIRFVDALPEHFTHPEMIEKNGVQSVFLTEMKKTLGELISELKIPADRISDVQVQEGRLEDVFLRLTQGA